MVISTLRAYVYLNFVRLYLKNTLLY